MAETPAGEDDLEFNAGGIDDDPSVYLPAPDPAEPVDKSDVIGQGGRWLAAWAGRFLVIAAAVFVIGWLVGKFWDGFLPVLLAILVASVLWPFTRALKRAGIPYGGGAAISLAGGVGVVAGLVSLIAPGVAAQWPILSTQAVVGVRRLQVWASGPPLNLRDEQLNDWITQGSSYLQSRSGDLISQALSLGGSLSSGLVTILLMLVLTFFFLKDGPNFLAFTRRVVGRRAGFHATELLTRLWTTVSGYIRTQAIVSLVDAVFNVLMGRYKVMTGEFADLMLGYYGECLGERNAEVIEMAKTQAKKEAITDRPADHLKPEWEELEAAASKLEGFDGSEEDVLTNAMFPGVAPKFFLTRADGPKSVAKTDAQLKAEKSAAAGGGERPGITGPIKYNVTIAGRSHSVAVEPA